MKPGLAWFQARLIVKYVIVCAGRTARESKHLQGSIKTAIGFMIHWHANSQKHQFPMWYTVRLLNQPVTAERHVA